MIEKLLKTTALIALGLFLYTRIVNDTVLFYINERFVSLTMAAAIGLVLVGLGFFFYNGNTHDHDHNHEHDAMNWWGLLIVVIPIILGLLVPPQPLGASALDTREINIGTLSSVAPPNTDQTRQGIVSGERNILDWLYDFQRISDISTFTGQEAHVIGFVYRDERFAENTFMVSRFTVSCCVADAAPVGLIVSWPEGDALLEDQWVDVSGQFASGEFADTQMPILLASDVLTIEPPSQPYLYR